MSSKTRTPKRSSANKAEPDLVQLSRQLFQWYSSQLEGVKFILQNACEQY